MKKKSWGAGFALKMLCCGGGVLVLAVLPARFVPSALPDAKAAQVRAVNIALRQAVGRVVFCVTKDTIIIAAADDGAAAALRAPGSTPPRPPAIAPLGSGRVAVVLGALDWTRDDGEPVLLDEELPAMARKVISSTAKRPIHSVNPPATSKPSAWTLAGIRAAFCQRHSLQARPGGG